jgi:hypothetical protein
MARFAKATPFIVIAYVALALGLDLLATFGIKTAGIDWAQLRWVHASGFDFFKFLFWLVVPLLIALPSIDWHYFTFRRWKKADAIFLAALTGAGLAAVLVIPFIPELREIYPNQAGLPANVKWARIQWYLVWDLSWLPGWEFLHRYFLLTVVARRWPRAGWLLAPLFEGLYHWPKSLIEALAMTLFSVAATQWALRRRNLLLPLFAHAAIEIALLVALFA